MHTRRMIEGWKLRAATKRLGANPTPLLYEYFYVAIPSHAAAVAALVERKQLLDAEIDDFGPITDQESWLNLQPGEIRCIISVS
jgi:uncharacterized protein YcaQ